jgi:diguanylate cyclase (GGDEF)-like protein
MAKQEGQNCIFSWEAHLLRKLHGWRKWVLTLVGTTVVALLGAFDFKTGIEVPLSMFYLLPVMAVSWYSGRKPGLTIAFLSAVSYFLTHHSGWGTSRTLMLLTADSAARLIFYSAISFIVASIKLYLERQYTLARTDTLTGAANPRRFYEQAELELARARRYRRPLTLTYFDIDNFKEINDTYGHQVGDQLLLDTAGSVGRAIRATDLMARMGGDEFAILMPETGAEQAAKAVDKILALALKLGMRKNYPVTFSFGVATFNSTPESVANMVFWADRLMYQAKEQGKNRVVAKEII